VQLHSPHDLCTSFKSTVITILTVTCTSWREEPQEGGLWEEGRAMGKRSDEVLAFSVLGECTIELIKLVILVSRAPSLGR
jgi:hypothetical protein